MAIRIKAPSIESRVAFDRCVDDIALSMVSLRRLEAVRDERIQEVRAEWDPACNQQIERIKALSLLAEKYAEEHRAELLPGKIKSCDTALAIFGFRTGMPQLKLLSKWTWEKVLAALKGDSAMRELFVRPKEEVDKAALISAGAVRQNLGDTSLSAFGCKVVQEETFYIEPKEKPSQEAA